MLKDDTKKNNEIFDCDFCDGTGFVYETDISKELAYTSCTKCFGTGELNWIELIFGKIGKRKDYLDSYEIAERRMKFHENVPTLAGYNSYVKKVDKNWGKK